MNKRLFLVLVALCVCNGMLVASDFLAANNSTGQDSKKERRVVDPSCLKMFYQSPAPASAYGINIDEPDRHGFTYLMHAVVQGNGAAIIWSLGQGARVNRANHAGATSITLAVQNVDSTNFYFKRRMTRRLLWHSPSLYLVQDPKREISPKGALALLRGYGSLGAANFSGADLLEQCIIKEERKRRGRVLELIFKSHNVKRWLN